MGITPLKSVKPQIFGHTLLKSIDIALRKFPQPYYDIEFVNFSYRVKKTPDSRLILQEKEVTIEIQIVCCLD